MQIHGNIRKRASALGAFGNRAWAYCLVAFALAAAAVGAAEFTHFAPHASINARIGRNVLTTGSGNFYYRINGGAWTLRSAGSFIGSVQYNPPTQTGGTFVQIRSVDLNTASQPYANTWLVEISRTGSSNNIQAAIDVNLAGSVVDYKYGSNGSSAPNYVLDPVIVSLGDPGDEVTWDDPLAPTDPEKLIESGVLMLENLTGRDLEIPFGDEMILLKPGYNAIPFYGEVGPDGFPSATPDSMILNRGQGGDGQTMWLGRIQDTIEGAAWVTPPGQWEILPPSSGTTGPILKIPGAQAGTSDYITLPPGMTAGNNVPLPPGMTPGSGVSLPAGVTPGTNGALPSGVISGGTSYLPPGVSAGTQSGNPTSSGGTGGTGTGTGSASNPTGGGVAGGGVTGVDDSENYVPGASMAGMEAEGKALGKQVADEIVGQAGSAMAEVGAAGTDVFGTGGFGFWGSPSAGSMSGDDSSWLNFTIPLAQYSVQVEIPENWITLIRAILLWGVKIWFVVAVIKLFFR